MFKITNGCGFHMTFDNGYTVSVQWGPGNYCDNHPNPDWDFSPQGMADAGKRGSRTAEVAAWDASLDWVRFEGMEDDVLGRQTPEQVLAFMARVAGLPSAALPPTGLPRKI